MKDPVYPFMRNAHILLKPLPQRPGFGSLWRSLSQGIPWPCGTGFREELLPFDYRLGGFSFPRAVADWDLLNPSLGFCPARSHSFSVTAELSQNVQPSLKPELWPSSLCKLDAQGQPFCGTDIWAEGPGHLNHAQRTDEWSARHTHAYIKPNNSLDYLHKSNLYLSL